MGRGSNLTRRRFLASLAGSGVVCAGGGLAVGCGGSASAGTSPTGPSDPGPVTPKPPLRQVAQAAGRLYGAAVEPSTLNADPAFALAVTTECGIITAENSLKWAALRPAPDTFDFSRGDALRDFAQAGAMAFRGHTLVWHNSLPSWFSSTVTAQNAERYLVDHISTVVRHYAGAMHSWDVVNEAIDTSSGRADGLRATPWLQMLGPQYVDLAFATAAAADPRALLCYNEYSLELASSGARRDATLRLLSGLLARRVPIHALGVQGHAGGTSWAQFDPAGFAAFLRDVAGLGLQIFISELDVRDNNLAADVSVRDQQVAAIYRDYLAVALAEPAVRAVVTWGLSDKYTWIRTSAPRPDGLSVRPLPLDTDMRRKAAWDAMSAAFGGPVRTGVPGKSGRDATGESRITSAPEPAWTARPFGRPTREERPGAGGLAPAATREPHRRR